MPDNKTPPKAFVITVIIIMLILTILGSVCIAHLLFQGIAFAWKIS